MARHLQQITQPVQAYLKNRFSGNASKQHQIQAKNGNAIIPEVFRELHQCGKAFLTLEAYKYFTEKHVEDSKLREKFAHHLLNQPGLMQEIVEKSNMLDFFHLKIDEHKQSYLACCEAAYYIVLWDARLEGDTNVPQALTRSYFSHFLPSLYPTKNKNMNISALKEKSGALLTQLWQLKPTIKESFETDENYVRFKLIAHIKNHHPLVLLESEGARLKTVRIQSYEKLYAQLNSPYYSIEKPAKKQAL